MAAFSAVASRVGNLEKGYAYFRETARLDLDDTHGNTRDGLHMANMAGAWVCMATGFEQADLAPVNVRFRDLNDDEIERYLRAEQPYDCAGSAKSEGLGIALLDAIDSDDPTALIGLPLIRTARLLRAAGRTLP